MSAGESTLHHQGSAAAMCRRRGWRVGTRLAGDEGHGPTVIEITAIGERNMLAKTLGHAGIAYKPRESSWVLWCRDWREAMDDEVPVALAAGERARRIDDRSVVGVVADGPDESGFYILDCDDGGRWRARVERIAE